MKNQSSIAAVILAGGKSSRLGQDKALIPLANQPAITQICQVAHTIASEVYVISPWIEKYQSILPSWVRGIKENSPAGGKPPGPLKGFAQALTQIKQDWVLLLACDLFELNNSELKNWQKQLKLIPDDIVAVLPKHPKGWEPLCGFYRPKCLSSLQEYIAQGGAAFQPWLRQSSVAELSVKDPKLLFNCNTPEDLEDFRLRH